MKHYVAGLDGGGTKTAMEVRSTEGELLLKYESGSLNYNSNTEEELGKTLKDLTDRFSLLEKEYSICDLLCISTAGISNPKAKVFFISTLRELGVTCDIVFAGDNVGALYEGLGKGEGIVLISGTGSICYGKNKEGIEYRTGGRGHLIDDEGSGYAIGRDILSAAVRIYDKREKESTLLPMVLKFINGTFIEDIIEYTYKASSKKSIAALAPILPDAIKEGDSLATAIGKKAAEELVKLVIPVVKELHLEQSEIVFAGGILTHYKEIQKEVENLLKEQFPFLTVIKEKQGKALGAVLIALEENKKRRERHG